jgi:inorganic phosphate transporter, PiT family
MTLLLILSALLLAFSNGANDNFKGFATVWGSKTLNYRQALLLATIATLLGSLASLFLAESLVQQFSGKGLVPNALVGNPAFIVSVGLAAAITVLMATRAGLPVSTTHALIGALVGAGLAHGAAAVNFAKLSGTFLLPLLVSPLMAGVLGIGVYRLLRLRRVEDDCACISAPTLEVSGHDAAAFRIAPPQLLIDSTAHCHELPQPLAKIGISRLLDRVHTLSAASICFARAVNDTPKLTALLVAASLLGARTSIGILAAVLALGGLLFARRVAETMSQRLVTMDHPQGLAANLITAGLVLFASKLGLPVSTTHVSVGAIAGTGFASRSIHWATVRGVLLSWVGTLPMAALIAYGIARGL